MKNIKSAAAYIRVSTVEQTLKGLSIETQIAEIKAYAKRHNMKLVDIYIDRGITARKSLDKRLDFMRMMHDVEAGKINHIIVLRLDRFFRNVYDYHRMMNEYLTPNNCDWSAVKEDYTTTTTNGRLMINLRLAIAEQECDTDSDRIKDIFEHRINEGFAISGSLPLGYKIENHRVVIDDETKHIVIDIFETFERLNSIRATMLYINEKYNLTYKYSLYNRYLKNPLFCGCYRDNKNYCEPIISKEYFDKIQRLLGMNIRVRGNKHTYIFSGLLRCDVCNNLLSGNCHKSSGVAYDYMRCNNANVNKTCTNTRNIREDTIEQYLIENVERLLSDYIFSIELSEKDIPLQKSNRKNIENKLARLNELYVNGFIDMAKYKADYENLQSQIIDDEPISQKKDLTKIKEFLQGNFKSMYKTLNKDEKRTLWRSVIKEIRIDDGKIKEIIFL